METTTEQATTRPFHETIVRAINLASSAELECLATLIKTTQIPKDHDKIISAWNKRRGELCWGDEDLGVPADLLARKKANTNKAEGEKKGVNLDEL